MTSISSSCSVGGGREPVNRPLLDVLRDLGRVRVRRPGLCVRVVVLEIELVGCY
jgi:hypothetical protein